MTTKELKDLFFDLEKDLNVSPLEKKEKQIAVKAIELYHKHLISKSEASFLSLNHQVKEGNL